MLPLLAEDDGVNTQWQIGLIMYAGYAYVHIVNASGVLTFPAGTAYVADGALHQCIGSITPSLLTGYLDGAPYASNTIATPAGTPSLSRSGLARGTYGAGNYAAMSVLTARVYSTSLTPAQAAQNYASGPTGTDYVHAGLVVDLRADRAFRKA